MLDLSSRVVQLSVSKRELLAVGTILCTLILALVAGMYPDRAAANSQMRGLTASHLASERGRSSPRRSVCRGASGKDIRRAGHKPRATGRRCTHKRSGGHAVRRHVAQPPLEHTSTFTPSIPTTGEPSALSGVDLASEPAALLGPEDNEEPGTEQVAVQEQTAPEGVSPERAREEGTAEQIAREERVAEEAKEDDEAKTREEKSAAEGKTAEEAKAKEQKTAEEAKAKEEKAAAERKAAEEAKAKEEKAAAERKAAEEAKAKEEKAAAERKAAEEAKAKEEKAKEQSPFRFFSPTSFWNEALPADAALDPGAVAIVGALREEVTEEEKLNKGPAINTTAWSVPLYTVAANQPTVKVILERAATAPTLQAAWEAVPLPANAKPAAGTDKHLVVWQPSTNRLWEFWHLEQTAAGWQAGWGGAIRGVSADSGAYGPEAWPGAKTGWGASASSLSIAGGLITLEDLKKGEINHALAISVPNTRYGIFAAPAQRADGSSSEPSSLPEGAHLRLEPGLDLAALHLPRLTLMMAEAAQRYGIVVRDTAANVAFYAQDPTPTGTNPYIGLHGYYEGQAPSELLASFPWSHLQLLKMELHG
jgi:hypothetical protein